MPTKFAIAVFAALTAFVVLNGDASQTARPAASPVEQGLQRFDSVLQRGLSQEASDAIHDSLASSISESAEFLRVPSAATFSD
jgi:hypothetical protein